MSSWHDEDRPSGSGGRLHTKPGTLLKSQIPVRTWADRDDNVPGRVEIERLRGRTRGNPSSVPVRQRSSDASLLARLQGGLAMAFKLMEAAEDSWH